jgi:hypothetical protein
MYMAWLCYTHAYDEDCAETKIEFQEPERWRYSKIIPIQFSVLHLWSDKDKELYR